MLFKDCLDDFSSNYFLGKKAYNVLIKSETRITTATGLVFADGVINAPFKWDEKTQSFQNDELKVIKEVWADNPSDFLKNNQELANSTKYILVEVPTNEN